MPYVLCGSEEREEFRDQVGRLEEEKEQFRKSTLELKGELEAEFWKQSCRVTEERSLEAEIARDKAWEKKIEGLVAAIEKKQRKKKKGAKDGKRPENAHPAKSQTELRKLPTRSTAT
ncbi:hypothetical protein BGX38DRAFT_1276706 [Terfezia claveryi]|nr:hypothetical protein BGX38DRAFT_1276706 [Terfezia claveryi]